MSVYWLIDSREELVTMTIEGDLSRADIEACIDAVLDAKALGYQKLVDSRASHFTLPPDDMLAVGVRIRGLDQTASGALALVLPAEVPASMNRLFGMLASASRPMRLFTSIRKANAWLGQGPTRHNVQHWTPKRNPSHRRSLPGMDRPALEKHLMQVNADLARGRKHIARQRQIVSDLEQSGRDTKTALAVLREAEASQAVYAAEADWLEQELAALS